MLKTAEGNWTMDGLEMETLAIDYFRRLYSLDDVEAVANKLPSTGFPVLDKDFSETEVELAIRGMGKYKAPGPDGYQPIFYQRCWDAVGSSVTKFVLDFFTTGLLPPETNDVLLVLIAKVSKPESITQFRPISLCNVLFKTITKVMVGRLKLVISKLIGPAQASFIPGRLSTDNIVLVQEAVHSMRRKKGRKGWMLLKLDLEKAYDRIRWDFLEDTLIAAGLSEKWVHWIMKCVSGPAMNLLWNGEKTAAFTPLRGLRQGDPISPYLFVLCMERLSHMIERSVESKDWKPISLSRGGPKLSHICFADDLILFAEASVSQVQVIRKVLETFCGASGQKVSLAKSKIFFSSNVSRDLEKDVSAASGIQSSRDLGKYLGMPILQKRMNKDTFGDVLARVSSRLAGWKSCVLSMAGRLTLTKAVLSSIPVHSMSSIVLPKSTLAGLDKISRSFLWGSNVEKKKPHLLAWKKLCRPKRDGGLGIRSSEDMNLALIAKVGWRLLHDTTSLWARVVRKKYKVGDLRDRSWLTPKGTWSVLWRGVVRGIKEVIWPGHCWVVGDGSKVRFWLDSWVSDQPLIHSALGDLSENAKSRLVKDAWIDGMGWDVASLSQLLPGDVIMEIMALALDHVTGATDRLSWKDSVNGDFSVTAAYEMVTRDDVPRPNMECFYNRVWRVVAPERVRIFIWLVSHKVIMTNVERKRRHLSDSDVCSVCKGGLETIMHVLRDCPAMVGIWERIVPTRKRTAFFSQSLLEWLHDNLQEGVIVADIPWSTTFAMTLWWSWKWRCGNVFGGNRLHRDRVNL